MLSDSNPVYLCATARLAHTLQSALNQAQLTSGQPQWQTAKVLTLQQWLHEVSTMAMLTGKVSAEAYPTKYLSAYAEKLLWQRAITQCLEKNEYAELFDIASLADAAQQANELLIEWQVKEDELNSDFISTETRQFMRWRAVFQSLCKKHDALEPARVLAFQSDLLQNSTLLLPPKIMLYGFDRVTPLLQKIIDSLIEKGAIVEIAEIKAAHDTPFQMRLTDLDTECRAAVAWARNELQDNPQAKLAIVSPILHKIRRPLLDLLDDTFHPQTLHAGQHELPRIYDISLSVPLADYPLVQTALNLLKLACNPRACLQAEISTLLLDVYWSSFEERDLRAQLDAQFRKKLLRNITLKQALNLTREMAETSTLCAHLQAMFNFQSHLHERLPSAWMQAFQTLLDELNWAKTRSLSSHEFQTIEAWRKLTARLAELDGMCGKVGASEAFYYLRQIAKQQSHQPKSAPEAKIQVLGILENVAEPLDGMWVIGMNDLNWPPAPRPNPLLPHHLQRAKAMPGASSESQAAFAQTIFKRLSHSAKQVIFSYAKHEGDRELRPSPLLAQLPMLEKTYTVATLAEQMTHPKKLEVLHDGVAPPVSESEQVRGGTKLLEAQAICPAWAFYQYRLGATKLEDPSDGLDQMLRGSLVHAALQHFWQTHRNSEVLKRADLPDLISTAIEMAIAQEPDFMALPATLVEIERNRLNQLLATWLTLEAERTPFDVEACEQEKLIPLNGLTIRCRIDRIDALSEGLLIIDYKTGSLPNVANWAGERITELQLPFYASIVLQNEQVVGACFARVNIEECKIEGASEANIGAGFKPMQAMSSKQTLSQFSGFDALLEHWRTQLNAIATEIVQGVADVRFADENDLAYCDVKPLLRIPERQWQFEQGLANE